MEMQSLNIEKREKISQLEQVINEQKEIIELLKYNNPHYNLPSGPKVDAIRN